MIYEALPPVNICHSYGVESDKMTEVRGSGEQCEEMSKENSAWLNNRGCMGQMTQGTLSEYRTF